MNWTQHTQRINPKSKNISLQTLTCDRGTMIEAGSETTSMQLNNMILAILSNLDVVRRAHEELDRVVGSDRTPNFNDESNLPYIRAIVKVV